MKVKFNEKNHSFRIDDVKNISYLYFPITNGYSLKSSITPQLNGDIKIDQNHFAMLPVSQEDLQNSLFGRHFWLKIRDYGLYNVSGVSARQKYEDKDDVAIEAGFLYHTVYRTNEEAGIKTTTTTFSPYGKDNIELTKVTIKNLRKEPLCFTPTLAVPLFSRSADNLRDHRHVTALLNSTKVVHQGITNKPTLSFDERGHLKNDVSYGVFVSSPVKYYNPKLQEFIGEGGSLDWPKSLLKANIGHYQVGDEVKGFEAIGAFQLHEVSIEENQDISFVFAIGIDEQDEFPNILDDFCNEKSFDVLLEETKNKWQEKLNALSISTSDKQFDHWVKWVSLQPILRRIYGCSFLPHHDYGRGGRGWRDLWQDCLALLLTEEEDVDYLLFNNFGGVRIDGSNATIIGDKPGEFLADRNQIVRVWMDHGAWPWNTTKLYIDRSGNYDFLFKKQTYFKDANCYLGKDKDIYWNEAYGKYQLTKTGRIYQGTILEHILVQNLVQFFHVGAHNNILLDGADWNDGLDMAKEKGESVAFTAFYAMNFKQIANLLSELKENGIKKIEVFEEIVPLLLDTVQYKHHNDKIELLNGYFESVKHRISGNTIEIAIDDIIHSLVHKSEVLKEHLRESEWITLNETTGFYNGYYNNNGQKLEGMKEDSIHMTLTGQVFPIMSDIATKEQVYKILEAANKYLYDEHVGGYRLNTDFKELKLDMGRLFGFAFGHKENGAMFSHMAMMFASALYKQGFNQEAYQILNEIYQHANQFQKSKIYPGIPEYFDSDGRGMYHYLTGSASWYILNVVTEMFGVNGKAGNLYLKPKFVLQQFDENKQITITTKFQNKVIKITYINQSSENSIQNKIESILMKNKPIPYHYLEEGAVINKAYFNKDYSIEIVVNLV